MEKLTQHQKIINLCSDGGWKCQNEFRALYIFSPHKRRSEIEAQGNYRFEYRKCEHGIAGQRDYRMVEQDVKKKNLDRLFNNWMESKQDKELSTEDLDIILDKEQSELNL